MGAVVQRFAAGRSARAFVGPPLVPDFCEWLLQTDPAGRYGKVFAVPLGSNGKPYSLERVSKVLTAVGKAANVIVNDEEGRTVKYASAHDLRRSFGTRWAMKCPAAVLKKLMRQASVETSMAFYADIDADAIAENLWAGEGVGTFVGSCEQPSTKEVLGD